MMTYSQRVAAARKLAILTVLAAAGSYAHNEDILAAALDELAVRVSRSRLRTDLAEMAEQGLVEIDEVGGELMTARLTGRGLDVAEGRSNVPGVARPRPGR